MDTETSCSRCSRQMRISRLVCTSCDVTVDGELELTPLAQLGAEDQMFVIAFLREHGSIRKMEKLFEISYPTVKKRLHALVDRIAAR